MNKQTKRIRRNRKNKSRKYYGGRDVTDKNTDYVNQTVESNDKSKGVFDLIGDKLSGYSGKAFDYVKDKGLRLAGLQEIKQPVETNNSTQEVDQKINEIGAASAGIVSDVKNVVDQGSAAVITNINDVLENPQVGVSLNEAANETAVIGEKLLENFNENLSTPELKEQTKLALDNAAQYTDIVLESMNEPINKSIDQLNEAGTKAASGAVAGLVKVGTDAMAAVPGLGAIIEIGKIANDSSAAIGDVVEAATDATTTISKVVEETSKNIDKGLDKLHEKEATDTSMNSIKPDDTFKKLNEDGLNVSNRVNKSINQFENPINDAPVLSGGRKTRRKFLKHKGKTKRVRFAI
jgi:hypothetical protein